MSKLREMFCKQNINFDLAILSAGVNPTRDCGQFSEIYTHTMYNYLKAVPVNRKCQLLEHSSYHMLFLFKCVGKKGGRFSKEEGRATVAYYR